MNLLAYVSNSEMTSSTLREIRKIIDQHIEKATDINETLLRRLSFYSEQLHLSQVSPSRRSFSSTTLVSCLLWHACSPACYRKMMNDNLFILPSERTLRNLTKTMKMESRSSLLAYLKVRRQKLNNFEAHVMLLFDEIYVHQHIDYAYGKFQGLTLDGKKPCTSVLSFMIKSLRSKYSDVISLIPTASLTVETLKRNFMEALQLTIGGRFSVIGSCCDNHTVNRSFLKSRLGCKG